MNGYDLAYGVGLAVSAPFWLIPPRARRKVLAALSQRMARNLDASRRDASRAAVMIHAVSLGEINATRKLVELLGRQRPDLQFIITTTTTTGYERGQQLYGAMPNVTLLRYPLDFSAAIARLLDTLRPSVIVLIELELWPNFMRQCEVRGIPVVLVNGRLTPHSRRNYRLAPWLARRMFGRLALCCVQDDVFARQFIQLGVALDRVQVTGTMKFDTATIADSVDGDRELAEALGLRPGEERIFVCGSTGPGEEELILPLYSELLRDHPDLRLCLIPRKPERFDEVAELIERHGFACIRRSRPQASRPARSDTTAPPVILGDTMGELRKFYSLADVVFVGRTLVDLGHRQHGSDMIEPAALAKPVIVGPFTHNFADAMCKFRAADAVIEVTSPIALKEHVMRLLANPPAAAEMARRAQDVCRQQQGATQRHVDLITTFLPQ